MRTVEGLRETAASPCFSMFPFCRVSAELAVLLTCVLDAQVWGALDRGWSSFLRALLCQVGSSLANM